MKQQEQLKEKEKQMREEFEEKEREFSAKQKYWESENRVLKELKTEINEKYLTNDKDKQKFHKTLRNMLLEEIERIESQQAEKEKEMEKWRENFEADMGGASDELGAQIDELKEEKERL